MPSQFVISILSPIITAIHLSVVLFNGAFILKRNSPIYKGCTIQHNTGVFGMEILISIVENSEKIACV
jgi:hypothetical protein